MSNPALIPINQLVEALFDVDHPLPAKFVYRLSDISQEELSTLAVRWPQIPAWRRRALMEDVELIGDDDTLLDFEAFNRFALQDEDPRVRCLAAHALWEYENPELVDVFLDMLKRDETVEVRAAVAAALGKFVYLGELEELPEATLRKIEDTLLELNHSAEADEVRRRALEALGFSSREEVALLIASAFSTGDEAWQVSALFAMGRSANDVWIPIVHKMLSSDSSELCIEAIKAAGELEAKECVPRLIELLHGADDELRMSAAWSLSQIGGKGVREVLEALYSETEDDEEADLLEAALDNLAFTEDIQLFDLIDIDKEDDDLLDEGDHLD
ncbi:MAG: HEAT repeat domain-containing protein [Anaerolineales bacterium]|nr:HEAT repeat domain-containing protein [Anaerolineales bacterium]